MRIELDLTEDEMSTLLAAIIVDDMKTGADIGGKVIRAIERAESFVDGVREDIR